MARECPKRNKTYESKGSERGDYAKRDGLTKQVQTGTGNMSEEGIARVNPVDFLYSEGEVKQVRIDDKGSRQPGVQVQMQGVPMVGVIDTGADITIMGGRLFKKVATVARLKKKDFKKARQAAKDI